MRITGVKIRVWLLLMLIVMIGGDCITMGKEFSVCIDAGHQGSWVDMSAGEPMAPGSNQTKAKATTGTQGRYTGVPEYQLNLDISLALEKELTERGYRVVMTRSDNDTAISNIERAQLASQSGCDILVRIHANGSDDPQVSGALAVIMSQENPYVGNLFEDSYRLALNVLDRYCVETGFANRGIQAHDDMTGINWSSVPVMILEMGFMTNQSDDTLMQDPSMQEKMVKGIADGIDLYFSSDQEEAETETEAKTENETEAKTEKENEAETETIIETESITEALSEESEGSDESMHPEPPPATDRILGISSMLKKEEETEEEPFESTENDYLTDPLMINLYQQYIAGREQQGQQWAVSVEELSDPEKKEKTEEKTLHEYNGNVMMQSASVIKVFIMGAVFDRVLYPRDEQHTVHYQESSGGELNSLLEAMITVSDNGAANRLIEIVGEGNFQVGAETIREFCMENGYVTTSIGRRFMEENPIGDNYTSAADCRKILSDIYYGKCVNEEASQQMLSILKRQALRNKIPSGLPSGFTCANKTGEMPEGYGLGCIENDIAIVFGPEKSYVLCVLSNNLGGDNTGAQQNIIQISSYTASVLK